MLGRGKTLHGMRKKVNFVLTNEYKDTRNTQAILGI